MHLADALRELDDRAVVVQPGVQVFSQWVEQLCIRIQLLRGQACDRTADAITLQQLWQEAMPASIGLSPESEKRLAGRLARTADKWLRQWYGADTSSWLDPAFFKARHSVTDTMRRNQLRDAEGWAALLIEILQSSETLPVSLPEQIFLDGFHELTRLELALLRALEAREVTVQSGTRFPSAGALQLLAFDDARTELAAAAHWARNQLAEGKQQIAVVINGLENETQTVRRVFENVFYCGPSPPTTGSNAVTNRSASTHAIEGNLFCIPAGEPLLDHAVIESALMLLQLSVTGPRQVMPFSRFSFWMLNPYWAAADNERVARAQLEIALRRDGVFQLVPASLQERAAEAGLADELEAAIATSRAALNPDWRVEDSLYQCLKAWGWPGPLVTGPRQQSAISQFVLLLERLRSLNLKSPAESLKTLKQMCQDARIKDPGGPLSPVQILSPDDAAGRRFDAAWVANLHEGNWPGSPLCNPYLPVDAAQHIPRAGHEGELAWTQSLTQALRSLAPEIIFSWGKQAGDTQLGASPLLADIPLSISSAAHSAELHDLLFVEQNPCQHTALGSVQSSRMNKDQSPEQSNPATSKVPSPAAPASLIQWRHYGEHPWLKARSDLQGWALQEAYEDLPAEAINGGASAISDQSALPLLSYLKHRLNAGFDPMPDAFADAALRGSLLHSALQRLYQPCLGSTELPKPGTIEAAVESALRERNAFQRLSLLQYESEKLRLIRVLEEWLEKDRQRPSFRIHALELPLEAPLLGHPMRLRADRIDELDDGSLLIIDYKSSKRATNAWARPRLGEAQVPLYARLLEGSARSEKRAASIEGAGAGSSEGTIAGLIGEARVGGIALAAVKHGECLLDGVVNDPAHACDKLQPLGGKSRNLDKRFENWPAAMAFWQQSIDALAAEYIRGVCGNVVYDRSHPGLEDFQLLLRHSEGEAWLLQTDPDAGGSFAADTND